MSDVAHLDPPVRLPNVSYGPFRLLEAVPWLMLATALRFIQARLGPLGGPLAIAAWHVAIFLAFLLAARRMIELTDGHTELGALSFRQQLELTRKVLVPVLLFMLASAFVVAYLGARWVAGNMLLGVDAIAFDQYIWIGMAWSAFLTALMLLMVLNVDSGGRSHLFAALRELWQRASCMGWAIIIATVAQIVLHAVQGAARAAVHAYVWMPGPPHSLQKLVFFFFVFGFAVLRLWMTLAIMTFWLRQSYRQAVLPTTMNGPERPT
ncbi:MAG: hypothetical protein P8Z80_17630 [Pseudolabrys sp.]